MYLTSQNKKYIKFLAVLVVISILSGIVLLNYSDNVVNEIRPMSERFMNELKSQNFNNVEKDLKGSINLEELFSNEGVIYTFKESGFGVDSKNDVWISYYVTGLPSETRNININYKKDTYKWFVADLQVSYHINRKDKQNVITFIEEIIAGNTTKAFADVKEMKSEKLLEIKNITEQYKNINDWEITKAINEYSTGNQSHNKPNKTKIYIQTPDKKYILFFLCKNINDKHWIQEINIIIP